MKMLKAASLEFGLSYGHQPFPVLFSTRVRPELVRLETVVAPALRFQRVFGGGQRLEHFPRTYPEHHGDVAHAAAPDEHGLYEAGYAAQGAQVGALLVPYELPFAGVAQVILRAVALFAVGR